MSQNVMNFRAEAFGRGMIYENIDVAETPLFVFNFDEAEISFHVPADPATVLRFAHLASKYGLEKELLGQTSKKGNLARGVTIWARRVDDVSINLEFWLQQNGFPYSQQRYGT